MTTRVAGSDQVLLLLRERLARGNASGRGRAAGVGRADRAPLERLRAMAGFDALDPDARRRAVVHGLLVEELGDAVANDAAFRAVLDEVLRIIGDQPGGTALIDRAAATLRGR